VAAATTAATNDFSYAVMGKIAANTADSEGEDSGVTCAEISLTVDPRHAEARATELNTASVSMIATSGTNNINKTTSTKGNTALISAIAVGSSSASSSIQLNRGCAGGFITRPDCHRT